MNSVIERGLRGAVGALADLLEEGSQVRPRQFRIEERPPDRRNQRQRRQSRQSEEQIEQDRSSEERHPREIQVEPPAPVRALSPKGVAVRRQLRDREGIRRAILLSEILDRPRALRPYHPIST